MKKRGLKKKAQIKKKRVADKKKKSWIKKKAQIKKKVADKKKVDVPSRPPYFGEVWLSKEINLFSHRLLIIVNDDILQYQTISLFSLQENNV